MVVLGIVCRRVESRGVCLVKRDVTSLYLSWFVSWANQLSTLQQTGKLMSLENAFEDRDRTVLADLFSLVVSLILQVVAVGGY